MAMLGSAMMGSLLAHSEAEQLFRPWWDALEDFVIYGLIMLGLIVSPTTIFNGTPLMCTQCIEQGQCGNHQVTQTPSTHNAFWVKTFCTQKSLTTFTLYFPYILLLSALLLVGIERLFGRIFSANVQLEGFYSLLKGTESEFTAVSNEKVDFQPDNMLENSIKTIEVRQSFEDGNNFFCYYLFRTITEFSLALGLGFYMLYFGIKEIMQDETVYCDVHGVYFECHGIPTQFYLVVLMVAFALLCLYLLSTFLTICWLVCPCLGKLARLMRNYCNEVEKAAITEGKDLTRAKDLMGELYAIYYENRDIRLLLDLLAITSGLAPALRIMALMDKNFRSECAPLIHTLERSTEVVAGESEVTLEFSQSELVENVLSRMDGFHLQYTAQIIPRTDKDSVEIFTFDRDADNFGFNYFRRGHGKSHESRERKKFVFCGVDADVTYTVIVTLVLNGRAIATAQKKLKAITPQITIEAAKAIIATSTVDL